MIRPLLLSILALAARAEPLDDAFHRMYNLDFAGAHRILDDYEKQSQKDPLAASVRAAAYLFYELDRLRILESEFLSSDKRIGGEEKLVPDASIRARFFEAVDRSQLLANERLRDHPNDTTALFAFSMTEGMRTDYMALVEKKQLRSLAYARKAHNYALQVIKNDPSYADAYMTTGITEYLVGSLPFFLKWFIKFDQVEGNKDTAVVRLNRVAAQGRYLGPFARVVLAIIHVREKRPEQSVKLLTDLSRDYPENRLYRNELAKLTTRLKRR
jgi:hypothetical protein